MAVSGYWVPSIDYRPFLDELVDLNVNFVEFNPIWYMPGLSSTEIRQLPERADGGNTISDANLRQLIRSAHDRGIRVFLKPMVEMDGWTAWRGSISPSSWDAWFESYSAFIGHYAAIAQEEGVELFSVGAELKSSNAREDKWRQIISEIRELYGGELTYSDSELLFGGSLVRFWDALDYIGLSFYYPATGTYFSPREFDKDPSLDEVVVNIDDQIRRYLEPTVQQYSLPVMITEMGIPSYDGAGVRPWEWKDLPDSPDFQEQVDYYEAVMRAISNRPWVKAFFWWELIFNPQHTWADTNDNMFDPFGKPAEETLRVWYHTADR